MPVVEIKDDAELGQRSQYEMQVQSDPTFKEIVSAHFATDNLLNNGIDFLARKAVPFQTEEGYDVWNDIGGYEGFADSFIGAESREESDFIKQKIDSENEARNVMASGGLLENLAAGVASGIVDPINFIPVGGTAYKTYKNGGNILEGAARTAFAGFAASSAEEAILQGLQETRTAEESAFNIAGATFLSGVIGSAGSMFTRKQLNDLALRVEDELRIPTTVQENAPMQSTVGAAAAQQTTLQQESLVGAFGLEKALSFQDPVLRTLNSPSKVTRELSENIAETALVKNKNVEGIKSQISIENMIKSYNLPKYSYFKQHDELFKKYRGNARTTQRMQDMFGKARRDGKLTYREFGEEVIRAARRGDEHGIPEIAEAAKTLRREVFDPIYKRAVDAGVMEEGAQVKTAPSYVTRLWDHNRILGDLPKFKEVNKRWLIEKRDRAIAELKEFKTKFATEIEAKNAKIMDDLDRLQWRASFEDAEIDNIVGELVDRITGSPIGRLPYDMKLDRKTGRPNIDRAQFRGAARERVYDIPDEMVEDFLVNDIDTVVHAYTRSLASDIEITKKFGGLDLTEQYKRIQDDYQRLAKNADPKTARKLKDAQNRDMRDLQAMIDRMRGVYGMPDDYANFLPTAGRIAKQWNYLTLLGGMTLSAFSDIATPVLTHGIARTYGDGIKPLVKNFRAFKAAAEDVKQSGTALDMVLDTRARALADMDEFQAFGNRVEDALSAASANFGVVSLMSPWNAGIKQFSGIITQNRILEVIGMKNIPTKEKGYLAANFIDDDMAKRIKGQFKAHGQTVDGMRIPNAKAWDDIEARDTFRAAVRRDVDRTIVTPGQDKPLWMSKAGLDLIGQFKSFSVASVQRTMLMGLQQKDAAAMNSFALMTFLGMGVYAAKTKVSGRETSDDWRVWVSEGIDRSGITGWFFEANNFVEKITRGRVGVNALVGGPPMSRYASRSVLEAALGPTYGTMGNLLQAVGSAAAGEWTENDTQAVRRLMPYQNLFYARKIFDDAETAINDFFGVTKKP